jgi:hypothetical protein
LKRNISWTRVGIGVSRQPGKARAAAATALSTSSWVQQGASAIRRPVEGSITGMYLAVFDGRHSLSTKYVSRSVVAKSCLNNWRFMGFSPVDAPDP